MYIHIYRVIPVSQKRPVVVFGDHPVCKCATGLTTRPCSDNAAETRHSRYKPPVADDRIYTSTLFRIITSRRCNEVPAFLQPLCYVDHVM